MRRVFAAMVAALVANVAPKVVMAQDAPWSVLRDTVSAIDGKRTFLVAARRGDLAISVGCDLGGPMVGISFQRAALDASPKHRGAYRAGQSAPVSVTWDGGDASGGALFDAEAKDAMESMFAAPIWHIRIGHEERSIDLHGLAPFADRVRDACLAGQSR